MKTNFTSVLVVLLLTTINLSLMAQNSSPFKVRFQKSLKGDMTLISNNISNRVDENGSSNTPFNIVENAPLNDELNMGYVDIDNDPSTFSSSSAAFTVENQSTKKIVYAGLYWSATFKHLEGMIKKDGKYEPIENKREAIKKVKIKLPETPEYIDLIGEVVFDGNNTTKYKETAPYVVYADVTNLLQNSSNPFGEYTVANIRASNGTLPGGISSGWSLFVVYEDNMMPEKNVTCYDGFANTTDDKSTIRFTDLQMPKNKNIEAKLACIALEGDSNLENDQLFVSNKNQSFIPLSNQARSQTNFFNSSITEGNNYALKRNPNSKNTLGYDSFIMNIPNVDNALFDENVSQTEINFNSNGDKSYLFFAALSIDTQDGNSYASVEENDSKTNKVDFSNDPVLADAFQSKMLVKSASNNDIQTEQIPNLKMGYYEIANVFSDKYFVKKFIKDLKEKGQKADYFVNPKNDLMYVYILKSDKIEDVKKDLVASNQKYSGETWVMSINQGEQTSFQGMLAAED